MKSQRDPKQIQELLAAYGSAMLFAHLIEDILKLHVGNCRHARVNGYERFSIEELNSMSHEKRIDELKQIYGKNNQRSISRLITILHQLRKLRNLLAHDFFIQIGRSMTTQEGIDQIVAMLNQIIKFESSILEAIQTQNRHLIESTSTIRFDAPSTFGNAKYITNVATSRMQKLLGEIEKEFE